MVAASMSKAASVCATCKARKKRCDKSLPCCGYCAHRNLVCRYQNTSPNLPPHTPDANLSRSSPAQSSRSVRRGYGFDSVSTAKYVSPPILFPSLASSLYLPTDGQTPTSASRLCTETQRLLGSMGLYLDEISVRYFQGIHAFVPIISRRRFHGRLLSFGADPQPDFALLLLCMGLLTNSADPLGQLSPQRPHPSADEVTLYVATKSLMAQAHALLPLTTHLIQAGVLLAVYEYALGYPERAFVTIGTYARMAYAAGMQSAPSVNTTSTTRTDWLEEQEENNTRWGIRICERTFLCELAVLNQPLASVMPAGDIRLPLESRILNQGSPTVALASSVAVHALDAPGIGGFGRAAQAAWLLEDVLRGLCFADPDRQRAHLIQCDRTMQSFLTTLMQQNEGGSWGEFCVAIALTIRALFLLHSHLLGRCAGTSSSDSQPAISHLALDTTTKMVVDIAATREHLADSQIDRLPPSCMYIIRAALKHLHDVNDRATTADAQLRTTLRKLEGRWGGDCPAV
ncbi:hypothetical protein BO82DRAFT_344533 [Aspergillus uvarum CBS 121591]|uniref:Zn(2)-C6 fungal-type domain-containing protein n=1 Tax=Aspergillus uvarum CBS 121591 TaxID=1448315 RepID=A0A319BXV5_9EURO|nr:hypothetical protein BO82DRAFT_344533 [Aspergillus uvarum CBS 121591]PYH77564.1 hypothetical protein BO82DRAFT_344533 [Aspergillus uvarum CBS 121591]